MRALGKSIRHPGNAGYFLSASGEALKPVVVEVDTDSAKEACPSA
jgi:hypothetical protein